MGYQPTNDGRVNDYRNPGADYGLPAGDHRIRVMQPFIDACLTVLPDGSRSGNARIGLFLFLLGAADRLWQRMGWDDRRFPPVAEALLQHQGVPAPAATALATILPQIRDTAPAREALLEGAELMDIWLDSHDANCLLRLNDLVLQWRDLEWPPLHPP